MITLTREEAQQVLDAVNTAYGAACFEAAKILRSKLSEPNIVQDAIVYGTGIAKDGKRIDPASIYKEPEPEPVAWAYRDSSSGNLFGFTSEHYDDEPAKNLVPLYTAPPQREWQSLTDGERDALLRQSDWQYDPESYGQLIEAKLREKNGNL